MRLTLLPLFALFASIAHVPLPIYAAAQNPPAGPAGGPLGPEFQVPYSMQTTGLTLYAPMQQIPGTAITKQNTSPLYPTSNWHVATAYLHSASQLTTFTASQTHSATTKVNPVSKHHWTEGATNP
jgi:hypothetical protein